ncbi:hypothetical protein AND_007702 [Anopheles darlingi]|uniref:Uncharacterized protein n=1 Tax=Anopheles darlingi TaxID=43151 RepID=W5J885_ANODA|nr:uncharacterized protein LOC125950565 [Anopheles darlingi]ETN60677.1 hypothetical protein AND_007702 [Anopheles darlingi]
MYVWIKSAAYLVVFGGLGYGLLELTKPSEEKLSQLRYSSVATDEENKKALFMKKIQEAAREEPIYLKKKRE